MHGVEIKGEFGDDEYSNIFTLQLYYVVVKQPKQEQ